MKRTPLHLHVFARIEDARVAFQRSELRGERNWQRLEVYAAGGVHRFIAPSSIEGIRGLEAASATYAYDVPGEVRRELDLRVKPTGMEDGAYGGFIGE